jgi:hypothetical protein
MGLEICLRNQQRCHSGGQGAMGVGMAVDPLA